MDEIHQMHDDSSGWDHDEEDDPFRLSTISEASAKFGRSSDTAAPVPLNYITRLMIEMEDALIKLKGKDLTIAKLEKMAVFIYESMSLSTRNYHSVQHVFDIISHDSRLEDNPIAILAACFHDCIYYYVDGGLNPVQATLLKGSFKSEGPSFENQDDSDYMTTKSRFKFFATNREETAGNRENPLLHLQMVETIFRYTPGQSINGGLNEYLSALVAVQMLRDFLPLEILAQIACCIEATIPFRQVDEKTGKSHMELLHDSMKEARQIFDLKISDENLVVSVQQACLLSNSDVANFGTSDRHYFLDNTWSLLPESHESLRHKYIYSVEHFHAALFPMYKFFGSLQPAVVFHKFQGVPDESEMDLLTTECTNNLAFGRTYVGAKLVVLSLVSGLAVLTGGDAPISLFTGYLKASERHRSTPTSNRTSSGRSQLSEARKKSQRASDFFRQNSFYMLEQPAENKCNQSVYEILANGRRSESSFDTKRSPWAAMLYASMGDEELTKVLKEQTLYPISPESAWKLLRVLPRDAVHYIASAMAEHALSRAGKLMELLSQLESKNDDAQIEK